MKHIVFDLDGTLFDTEFEVSRITANLATQNGCPISAVDVFNQFAGYGSKAKFSGIAALHGKSFSEEELDELRDAHGSQKQELYDQDHIPVIEYVPETLEELEQSGYLLSIGSSNKTPRICMGLDKTGLRHHFKDRVYGPDLTNDIKKPDPAVFLYAMNDNGSSAENTVIVEDNEAGITAGYRTGAYVVAYLDPRFGTEEGAEKKAQEFKAVGANSVIRDYKNFVAGLPF